MEQHVKKQNSFFQTRMNQAKLGAYYKIGRAHV